MDWILSCGGRDATKGHGRSKVRFTTEGLISGPIILILVDKELIQVVTSPTELGKGKPKIRTFI